MYFFKRAQDLEIRSQDLFTTIAKKESEKRMLMDFLEKLESAEKIKNTTLKEKKIKALKKEFEDKQILSVNLDKYTNDPMAHEFLLKMLTLNDFWQLKLATRAITGNERLSDELLSSDIGLFELFIKDRKKFLSYATKLFEKIKSSKKIFINDIVKDLKESVVSKAI